MLHVSIPHCMPEKNSKTSKSDNSCLFVWSTVDVNKASGSDEVSAYMLQATAEFIAPSLAKPFSLSLSSGKFPSIWKEARVVPIHKSDSISSAFNYQPISLLSVVSKLLEKYIYSLLWDHLSVQAPLSNKQWGFQPGKSTVASLLSATYEWNGRI